MRKFRKICKNPFILSFICISFLLLSFNRGSATPRSKNVTYGNVSVKDVFRSVIFADGPLTSKIACLKRYDLNKRSLTNEQVKEYRKMESRIMSHLENNNPNYFENFRDVIKSQDLNLISGSLRNVTEDILLFLKKERENNRVGLEDNLKSYQSNLEGQLNVYGQRRQDPRKVNASAGAAVMIILVLLFLILPQSPTETSSELMKLIQKRITITRQTHC